MNSQIPSSENPLIGEVLDSIRRRAKAWKGAFSTRTCEKVIERDVEKSREKIELTLMRSRTGGVTVRLSVWDDRWVWLDIREGSKAGWLWTWTDQGRLSADTSPRALIEALDSTIRLLPSPGAQFRPETFTTIWNGKLLNGPIGPVA